MKKFIKTALLDVKERTEPKEIQLDEVRTDTPYTSLNDGLKKSHTNTESSLTDRLEQHYQKSYEKFYEDLLDDAGLYKRKGSYDQPLGFMVDSCHKGVDEKHIQEKLKKRHTNK